VSNLSIRIGLLRIEGVLWWILGFHAKATSNGLAAFCIFMAVACIVAATLGSIFKNHWLFKGGAATYEKLAGMAYLVECAGLNNQRPGTANPGLYQP